ncbi:MAG: response regulator [Candidatus Latescibacteria bacterium]|nr:response regulator [Candidatus Latescibacterota bacterium]
METVDELRREVATLRERLSRHHRASLRINESLDAKTVLHGILESARSLTDAKYGVVTALDEAGRLEELLTAGLSPDEHRALRDVDGGAAIHEHFCRIPGPLRLHDVAGYLRGLGLPEFRPPMEFNSFLGVPIRLGGTHIGNFYLGEKKGSREFTLDDEETLSMFASQAALVISNARRYRDEARARTDLETLIDTSPVGVVVFDARTGEPVTFNREAKRIVDGLRIPDQSVEQLLEVITVHRSDGRQLFLERLSVAELLSAGEKVRAEEVVLQTADGRSVTVLINATPIRSDSGGVASCVLTIQDMTSLEELDRLRAEFLAMVSHELRTPLAAIKGSTSTVLGGVSAMGAAEMVQFFRIINQQADHMDGLLNDLLDVVRIETGTLQLNPEPVSITDLVEQARKTYLNAWGRDNIHIDLALHDCTVMADRRRILQVLSNLLSNAARYSAESSLIRVTAARKGIHLAVTIADHGQGISAERLPQLFRRISRKDFDDKTSEDIGVGWGLAISKGIVEAHGGRIWAESEGVGKGARLTFTIPTAEESGFSTSAIVPGSQNRGGAKRQNRMPILVVDDDPQTLRSVREVLSNAGYVPFVTGVPEEVSLLVKKHRPHLVLMDLVLPGTDGIAVMKEIRLNTDVPVIFLSAYGHEDAIARAFEEGAADYVVKPFSSTELAARISAALRKRATTALATPEEPFVLGDLTINYALREVTFGGRPVRVTDIEYRLLVELSVKDGQIVSYEDLLERIWGRWTYEDRRPLRTTVKNIRRKLGIRPGNPDYILNERRVGYRIGIAE